MTTVSAPAVKAALVFGVVAILAYLSFFVVSVDHFSFSLLPVHHFAEEAALARQNGNVAQAITLYRKAVIEQPTAESYSQLITLLVGVGSLREAMMYTAQALHQFPADSNLLRLNADLQVSQ